MIEKIKGGYHLVCDVCGEEASETFEDFQDAVDYKKAEGWRSKKIGDDWIDACPDCE